MRYWSVFCSEKFPNHMQIWANLSKLHFFLLGPRNKNCCYIQTKRWAKCSFLYLWSIFLYKRVNLLCKFTFYCKKWTQLDKFVLTFLHKKYNLHNNKKISFCVNKLKCLKPSFNPTIFYTNPQPLKQEHIHWPFLTAAHLNST